MSYRTVDRKIFIFVEKEDIKKFLRARTKYLARRIGDDNILFKDEDFEIVETILIQKLNSLGAFTSRREGNLTDIGNLALPEKETYSISFTIDSFSEIDASAVTSAGVSFETAMQGCALAEWLKFVSTDQQAIMLASADADNYIKRYATEISRIRKFNRTTPTWL
jgi:hypothetical protein